MPSNEYDRYDSLCEEIYRDILGRLERKHEDRFQFAPRRTAENVLHDDLLLRFFQTLTVMDHFNMNEEDLVRRMHERELHNFLAILIFASCGIKAARKFTTELVASDTWPVLSGRMKSISSLPAEDAELSELFDDIVATDKFFKSQACFCPVVIRKREEVRVQNPDSQRLPYLNEQPLGSGAFGKVFKVTIARGHFEDPNRRTVNSEPHEMARKDYILSSEFPHKGKDHHIDSMKKEREIMEKILTNSPHTCQNVLEHNGSIEVSQTTYSLFMPLAICDLSAWMTKHHTTRPSNNTEKAEIILSAEGLAGGLNFLHNEMRTTDMEELVCYHMDLKPSNILIFSEVRSGKMRHIWKISDFGMARVKIRRRGQDGEMERDFNSWFVRRQKQQPKDSSLSATVNRRGDGTYLAPESISSARTMKADSDVWSLGCVISVVFAYLEEGGKGVEDYARDRMYHADADLYDRFFLRGSRFTPFKVHPMVYKWHKRLVEKASQRDHGEGDVVKGMLTYLEDAVFHVNQHKRSNVQEVQRKLLRIYQRYNKLGEETRTGGNTGERQSRYIWQIAQSRAVGTRAEIPLVRPLEVWNLPASGSLKGCEISSDGTLVVYWTDTKILLFTSQSLSTPLGDNTLTPADEYSLEPTSYIWKTLVLTRKYLVASTTGANFQCYIFKLGGASNDPSLDHRYRVTLQHPEINRLAISPDSQTLACILQGREDNRSPGFFFYAPLLELIQLGKTPRPQSPHNPSNPPGRLIEWDWPTADIARFSFSTNEEMYIVVRPELTIRSPEHKIPIIHVNLTTMVEEPLIVESRGFDNSSAAGLFTTMAAFRQNPTTCAVITREKQLHIKDLLKDDQDPVIQRKIHNYRVLKLMMGWHDSQTFALGRHSANRRMLLLEMSVPQLKDDQLVVRELAQLPGLSADDEFSARLSDERGEKYVLIAALLGGNHHSIYRVRITQSESKIVT